MGLSRLTLAVAITGVLLLAPRSAHAQTCDDSLPIEDQTLAAGTHLYVPDLAPASNPSPIQLRSLKYAALSLKHRLSGLASYYSTSLDGTLTATGAIFRNRKMTAAHLTLPLGSWVEITARATGRKIRVLVNDRGPYVKKFAIDLSQAAARALGVDVAEDRHVDIQVIALPGEEPLPRGWDGQTTAPSMASAAVSTLKRAK